MKTIQHKSAAVAGVSLLIMTVAAFFSYGFVHSSLVVAGDGEATLRNIQAGSVWFGMEIVGWVVIVITDLVVAWCLVLFLKPFDRVGAWIGGGLRLVYTVVLAIAVSHLAVAGRAAGNPDGTAVEVMGSIAAFEDVWSLGLILFGFHLMVVGYVAVRTGYIPKPVSILLILAGFGYTLIHGIYTFMPSLESVTHLLELILMAPMFVGEIGFGIWLLVRGRKLTMD
ncbi:DUF4386 domain-containing protein [Bacillus sp. KH172YL63]|uniref:DUF4386 domain-containing protein n=1 Tax=Bacillus sp. KH172YL63 TaxID=2709784 RepID=UPI0013E45E8A|nr:DUF4386 domain-containing protein [Bacillus sp. KH172YL63]BCB05218.1 hypothetical protein KH172YL63_33510 [Bacillus sp. KH172YL63]